MTIDVRDKKILAELDSNARQTHASIAKKIGLSKDVVAYRIKQLEAKGVIPYYYAIINNGLLGLTNYRVYIGLRNATPEKEQEILQYLHQHPHTSLVVHMEGHFQLGFMTTTKYVYDVKKILDDLQKLYKEYMAHQQISIFTKVIHYVRGYLGNTSNRTPFLLEATHHELVLTDVEQEMLRIVSTQARISLVDLAQKLDITVKTASHHLKKLERVGVIQGYRCMINLQALDMYYYKIDMNLETMDKYSTLLEFCLSHPNIIYVDETVGGKDFEFEVEVKNREELTAIINAVKRIASITDYSILSFGHYYPKLNYLTQR